MKRNNVSPTIVFLSELRRRLINWGIVFFVCWAFFLYFSNILYDYLALPLLRFLPEKKLIATQVISPFFVPFKLASIAALLLSTPFLLYQLWAFLAPALYQKEKRLIWPFLAMSIFLFYGGIAFAYFVIFPLLFRFFTRIIPHNVLLMPDMGEYLEFTTRLCFVFGILFEIPIIMGILVATGLLTRKRLIDARPYAIVGAFIIGMLFAPPDVLSQTLLAIPIWLLYEIGIFLTYFLKN